MPYTLYDASFRLVSDALDSLSAILEKAEASPQAAKVLESRMHENMRPFPWQVYFATSMAFRLAHRVGGIEDLPAYEMDLETWDDLRARVAAAKAALGRADKDAVDARADEITTVDIPGDNKPRVPASALVNGFILPNVFFHVTTAYDLARKEGVELGKLDYIKPMLFKYVVQ